MSSNAVSLQTVTKHTVAATDRLPLMSMAYIEKESFYYVSVNGFDWQVLSFAHSFFTHVFQAELTRCHVILFGLKTFMFCVVPAPR